MGCKKSEVTNKLIITLAAILIKNNGKRITRVMINFNAPDV